jgi:hypothetical protein
MKNTIAAKHATAKKILACPQSIFLLYETLGVGCVEQIAARLIGRRVAANIAKLPELVRKPWSAIQPVSGRVIHCSLGLNLCATRLGYIAAPKPMVTRSMTVHGISGTKIIGGLLSLTTH